MAINVPLSAQLQNATQLQQQVQNAVNAVRINLGGPNGARALSSLSQPLGRLTGQADEFTKSLDAANARVLAFGASVGVVNAVANAFKSLVSSTIEVEKAITAISVVGDQFNGKTKELSQGLFNIAKTTGQSFADVSKAALEFSRQGLNLEDTLARTKDSLILTRTTGLDAAKAVEGLTAAVNGFSKAGLSTTQVLNKFAAVDQAFAVSAADLTEAFQRAGAVAEEAGISFDEFSGIITALQTKTSRGGAVIGNALKTIFSRLKETSTLTKLTDLGVAVEDLQGNLLPARQILQNLATDIQGLGEITKAGIFKDVAGTFQLNQLVSLVNDLNNAQSISAAATQKSAGATNEAYVANEKLNQSLDALLNKVAITGKQLGSILGEIGLTDNLKGLLDGVNSFLEDVNGVLQGDDIGSNFAKGFVKGIGAVLSGPGLGIFLAIIAKLSYDLLKFGTQSLKTFFGIGKAANDQKQIQESIVQTLLKNQNVLNSILSAQGGQNAQGLKFLGILNQQAAAMQSIQGLAGNIAGTVYSAGYRQTDRGLARRSAGGYLPAQEASDVRRGVGGASPSSKVVSIPNFAFGGGKRGTMVANTSEYIVPNYAGGGSAIFNQDMVKTMGLPAGAKKINAAGGFIPNFASETSVPKDVSKTYALITNQASDTKKGITFSHTRKDGETVPYIADVYGIDTSKFKGSPELYERRFSAKKLQARYTNLAIKDAKNFAEKAIGLPLSPVSIQNLTNAGSVPSLAGTIFETAIQSILTDDELINLMSEKGGQNARFDFIGPATSKIGPFFGIEKNIPYYLEAKSTLSPNAKKSFAAKIDSVERGNTAPAQEISNIASIKAQWLAYQNRENKRSGFEDFNSIARSLNIDPTKADKASTAKKINKIFGTASTGYIPNFADLDGDGVVTQRDGFYTRLKSAAKKYSKNPAVDFVLNQIIQSTLGLPEGVEVMEIVRACDQALEAMKPEDELNKILRQKSAAKKSQKRQSFLKSYYNSSSGYVPNFAAAALQQAIAREKSAGLSNSQIYVDQNSSLKSPLNPMGLMVANTRDEPFGGIQGISRARKEGINPKTYGAANGFVPNYVNYGMGTAQGGQGVGTASSLNLSSPTTSLPDPGKIADVNKGFGDTAGKIIILQSALAFLSGAVGEGETSMEKFTQQLAQSAGNITSAGFLFQQIAGTETKTKFGGFIKNLGLVGAVAVGAYEGFKLVDYGFKEFSGQNKRTADALAKLETAAQGAVISLEDLTPEGQRRTQETGKTVLESFSGSYLSNLFSEAAGKNPEIQKQVGLLSVQGVKTESLKDLFEKEVLNVAAQRLSETPGRSYTGKTKEEVIRLTKLDEVLTQYAEAGDLAKAASNLFKNETVKKSAETLGQIKGGLTAGTFKNIGDIKKSGIDLNGIDPQIINDLIDKYAIINQQKKQEQQVQNAINFGERLNLELAKKQVDSVFEIAKLKTQATTEEEAGIQYRMQTLDLSNREKIIAESKLKLLELEKKARADIVDSVSAAVDKAQGGLISVDVGKLNELKTFLSGIDFTKDIGVAKFDELANKLKTTYDIAPEQVANLIDKIKEEQKTREGANKTTGDLIKKDKERALIIDDVNQSLQNQLSIFQRIAQTAQSVAGLNISFGNLDIGKNESEISRLQALSGNPNLTTDQKENIDKQVIALQKKNNELKKSNDLQKYNADSAEIGTKILEKQNELNRALNLDQSSEENQTKVAKLRSELEGFGREQQTLTNNFNGSKIAIDANTLSLTLQEQQIGKVVGAYASLNNQLLAFRRGAGERVAGAQLEALGATDINSLAKAGIKTDVEANASGIKDNAEYYKTIQEQTRLREIQFDLATAESATRKRELEYELKYTKELIDLKNKGATEQELIDARNRQISEQRSGARGFEKGLDTIQDRINNYRTTLGEEIPNLFSSNLAQGLNDAISGAKDLKTALTDAATSFFQEITKRNISNLADIVTGGLGKGASSGGGILSSIFSYFGGGSKTTGLASGGFIKGGSGTKDDVPAMLMGGEYVVKKSAVSKYGKGFLDAINSGSMRGYATGGMVDPQTFPTQTGRGGFYTPGDYGQGAITGKNELLTFASQSFTSGQYDYMGGIGMGGATVSLEPESARLSALGREGSPMFERVQQSKDEAFRVYLEGLQKEKEYSELLDQIAKDKKARKKQLQMAIISAVASAALSYGASGLAAGGSNAVAAASKAAAANGGTLSGLSKAGTWLKGAFGTGGASGYGGLGNIFKGNFSKATVNFQQLASAQGLESIYNMQGSALKGVTVGNKSYPAVSGGGGNFGSFRGVSQLSNEKLSAYLKKNQNVGTAYDFKGGFYTRRASGGLISGGSNVRDDVPSMLTGGEFVLNNRATQRLGVQNLNKLNSGASVSSEGSSAEMTQALVSKLDELIQATSNSSKENVVVNVSTSEADGQKQENPAGAEKELHKKIRQAVLDVIAQEKRLGGSLEKSR